MKNASSGGSGSGSSSREAMEEISLPLTTQLFTLHAKNMSDRETVGGHWSRPGCTFLREGVVLKVKGSNNGKWKEKNLERAVC